MIHKCKFFNDISNPRKYDKYALFQFFYIYTLDQNKDNLSKIKHMF